MRPSVLATQTVNLVSPITSFGGSEFSDPIACLADVDLSGSAQVIVQPNTASIKRSGTLNAIITPFSRTSTGMLTVTDGGVANWSSDVDLLFLDTTLSATAWVETTAAANAQGVMGALRPTIVATSPPLSGGLGASQTAGGADSYQIINPLKVYCGTGARVRQFPSGAGLGTSVVFRRLWCLQSVANEVMAYSGDGVLNTLISNLSSGAFFVLAESRVDVAASFVAGGVVVGNSAFPGGGQVVIGNGNVSPTIGVPQSVGGALLAGYSKGQTMLLSGGMVDQDYGAASGNSSIPLTTAGEGVLMGNVAIGQIGADTPGFYVSNGIVSVVSIYDAGSPTVYGSSADSVLVQVQDGASLFLKAGDSFSTDFSFQLAAGTMQIKLAGQAQGYGWNTGTGVYVGPTTMTLTRMDAALAAGTGLGKNAVDPRSNARAGVYRGTTPE